MQNMHILKAYNSSSLSGTTHDARLGP